MKITKLVHSCLLIETNDKKILIDPGNYTYDSNLLDVNAINDLDYLLITHEHPDHMYLPLIKKILAKFPNLQMITNPSTKKILEEENIDSVSESTGIIKIQQVAHERIFGSDPPENMLFNIADVLTHPGDSLQFSLQTEALALPVQAPWCSLTQAVEFAISQKPQVILPIHDWHWNDTAREMFYLRLEKFFKLKGIKFLKLEPRQELTI